MSAPSLRVSLRRRRQTLRLDLARSKRHVRERLKQHPQLRRRAAHRRRRRIAFAVGLLIVLACLRSCACGERPVPPTTLAIAPRVGAPRIERIAVPPPLSAARIGQQRRPNYQVDSTSAPAWLDSFRLQVAARSPKLAGCFRGTEKPGALRWTTAMDPDSGLPSDHGLELLGGTVALREEQRECLLQALSSPPYRLRGGAGEPATSTPSRVSIVLEF